MAPGKFKIAFRDATAVLAMVLALEMILAVLLLGI
jgi:hypothetical protein